MSKANEPAYPLTIVEGTVNYEGLSKREKLAMEIFVKERSVYALEDETGTRIAADLSLRAADIFFEQLNNKDGND